MERTRSCGERKRSKSLVSKTLQRCRTSLARSRWEAAAAGWVAVRVGPAKEKFLVRAEWMNHRLFRHLLDEAEEEYGYATKGALELPCSVDLFRWVIWELDQDSTHAGAASPALCGFAASPMRGYRPLNQSRLDAAAAAAAAKF